MSPLTGASSIPVVCHKKANRMRHSHIISLLWLQNDRRKESWGGGDTRTRGNMLFACAACAPTLTFPINDLLAGFHTSNTNHRKETGEFAHKWAEEANLSSQSGAQRAITSSETSLAVWCTQHCDSRWGSGGTAKGWVVCTYISYSPSSFKHGKLCSMCRHEVK